MTLTLVGVGGRFAHFCNGKGCAVCHWQSRRAEHEIILTARGKADRGVVGDGKMEEVGAEGDLETADSS
jgi:hypothetical protein